MNRIDDLIDVLKGEDDLGVVIRSHLIVEQYLNALIESLLKSPRHYEKMNIDYSCTIKLAIALGLNPRFESSLNVLGTIRNGFAHNLRSSITDQDAKNLYKTLDPQDKRILQETLKSQRMKINSMDIPDYQKLKPKEKFILNIMVICGNVHTAYNLSPNKAN